MYSYGIPLAITLARSTLHPVICIERKCIVQFEYGFSERYAPKIERGVIKSSSAMETGGGDAVGHGNGGEG